MARDEGIYICKVETLFHTVPSEKSIKMKICMSDLNNRPASPNVGILLITSLQSAKHDRFKKNKTELSH